MSSILQQKVVLVLNKAWQATGAATALDIDGQQKIRPVTWEEWITLPVREQDRAVQTIRGGIRVPTVIVLANYAKVPKKRPKLCAKSIRERDGNRCQYTGRMLRPEEGSLDHVMPRSRGGKNAWENLVWSAKDVNAKKANAHDIPEWGIFLQA